MTVAAFPLRLPTCRLSDSWSGRIDCRCKVISFHCGTESHIPSKFSPIGFCKSRWIFFPLAMIALANVAAVGGKCCCRCCRCRFSLNQYQWHACDSCSAHNRKQKPSTRVVRCHDILPQQVSRRTLEHTSRYEQRDQQESPAVSESSSAAVRGADRALGFLLGPH